MDAIGCSANGQRSTPECQRLDDGYEFLDTDFGFTVISGELCSLLAKTAVQLTMHHFTPPVPVLLELYQVVTLAACY
jgi:hypothetical protein